MKSLEPYRCEIDEIDDQILKLLSRRAKAVVEIGVIKKANGERINLHTAGREAEIFERLFQNNHSLYPNEAIRHVFREIMSASLCLESPVKVAFLGPEGTFTHLAGLRTLGSSAEYVAIWSIDGVFHEVERGGAHFGIVPIENSTEGLTNRTRNMLRDTTLTIYGEVSQQITHHLVSKSATLEDITTVYAHPQVTEQCRKWLGENLAHVPVINVASTGQATERSLNNPTAAAIASELAASRWNLNVLGYQIEDCLNDYTHFLVLSKTMPQRTRKSKTSLMIETRDQPAALSELFAPFTSQGIRVTNIAFHRSLTNATHNVVFLDIEGHIDDEPMTKTLAELKTRTTRMKILGSYPTEET